MPVGRPGPGLDAPEQHASSSRCCRLSATRGLLADRRIRHLRGPMPTPAVEEDLRDEGVRSLSAFEYALYVVVNGFWRWQVTCAERAGVKNLAPLDIEVLHSVNNRARNKRLGDICLVMNIAEPHVVSYCLKKLIGLELVTFERAGRDRVYCASPTGDEFCERYRKIRREFLIDLIKDRHGDPAELTSASKTLREMSRIYDDARRAATIA